MAGNCAWCGDPGDENGSHSICDKHRAEMLAQSQARHPIGHGSSDVPLEDRQQIWCDYPGSQELLFTA